MILEKMAKEYRNAQQMLEMAEKNPEYCFYILLHYQIPFRNANKELFEGTSRGEKRRLYQRNLPEWAKSFESDKAKEYVEFLESYKKYIEQLKNNIDQLNDKICSNKYTIKISRKEWIPIISQLLRERYNQDYKLYINTKDFGITMYKEYFLISGNDIRKIYAYEVVKSSMTDKQFQGIKGCMFLSDEVVIKNEEEYMEQPIRLHIGSIRKDNGEIEYPVDICDEEITELARDYFINLIQQRESKEEFSEEQLSI